MKYVDFYISLNFALNINININICIIINFKYYIVSLELHIISQGYIIFIVFNLATYCIYLYLIPYDYKFLFLIIQWLI